jgi:hypothetical protein
MMTQSPMTTIHNPLSIVPRSALLSILKAWAMDDDDTYAAFHVHGGPKFVFVLFHRVDFEFHNFQKSPFAI